MAIRWQVASSAEEMSPEVISLDLVLAHLGPRHLSPELSSQHRDSPGFSLSCQKRQKFIF